MEDENSKYIQWSLLKMKSKKELDGILTQYTVFNEILSQLAIFLSFSKLHMPGLTTQSISVLNLTISILSCKTSTETAYLHKKVGHYAQKKTEQLFRLFRIISV